MRSSVALPRWSVERERGTVPTVRPQPPAHALAPLLMTPSPRRTLLAAALGLTLLLMLLSGLWVLVGALGSELVYDRDFLQEYLLARAITDHLDPYQPIQVLAARYLGPTHPVGYPHPSPHPPTVGLLALPLAWLDFVPAAITWCLLGLVGLLVGVRLLAQPYRPTRDWRVQALLALGLLAWNPVQQDLWWGNVTLLLLPLLAGCWIALTRGQDTRAGLLLGLSLLIKPLLWPLLPFLLLRRADRAVGAALAVSVVGYGVAGLLLGWSTLATYVVSAQAVVTQDYAGSLINLSLWSVGLRLFTGTGSLVHNTLVAPPFVANPSLAMLTSFGLPAVALLSALVATRRLPDRADAAAVIVAISLVVSPLTWHLYLVLALIPLSRVLARLGQTGFPRQETNLLLVVLGLLVIPLVDWVHLAIVLNGPATTVPITLAPLEALIPLAPTVGVLLLAWLTYRCGTRHAIAAARWARLSRPLTAV